LSYFSTQEKDKENIFEGDPINSPLISTGPATAGQPILVEKMAEQKENKDVPIEVPQEKKYLTEEQMKERIKADKILEEYDPFPDLFKVA